MNISFNKIQIMIDSINPFLSGLSSIIAILTGFLVTIIFLYKKITIYFIETPEDIQCFDLESLKSVTKYYVKPLCTNVDPAFEEEPRDLVSTEEPLFNLVDKYLSKDNNKQGYKRFLLVLGDSGMGKTSFLLNYYFKKVKEFKKQGLKLVVIPLGHPKAFVILEKTPNPSSTILFLDALDEDDAAIKNFNKRFKSIMELCSTYRHVVITCRTQFFPTDEDIPTRTGQRNYAPRSIGESGDYKFIRIYISPLNNNQIKKIIALHFPINLFKRRKAMLLVNNIPDLAVRPMLLSYIPELLKNKNLNIKSPCELYKIMVDQWIIREKYWVENSEALKNFSESLAFDIYSKRDQRGQERMPLSEIIELARKWNIALENWHISGRSLLNRNASNYKFSHRSILEYLFLIKYLKLDSEERERKKWTDQIKTFCLQIIRENLRNESLFFNYLDNLSRLELSNSRIRFIRILSLELSGSSFSKSTLEAITVINSIMARCEFRKSIIVKAIFKNCSLYESDFSNSNITDSDFSTSDLSYTIMRNSTFTNCNLKLVNMSKVDAKNSKFIDVDFSEAILDQVDLRGATLERVNLKGAKFTKLIFDSSSKFIDTDFNEALFIDIEFEFLSIINSNFKNNEFTGIIFKNSLLKGSQFQECNFNNSLFKDVNLEGSILSDIDFSNSKLIRVNLNNSKLIKMRFNENSIIERSTFEFSEFKTINFNKVFLKEMELKNTEFIDVSFLEVNIISAKFSRNSNLHQDQKLYLESKGAIFI
jgi:uncharacterized protein YjbI with pentapeptide repeats